MSESRGFAELQARFTAHLRDPQGATPPAGVEPRRVAVYARLLFNNIDALLSKCFPVLRAITSEADWQALVRDFLAEHRSRTPLFPRIPQEFAHYLANARGGCDDPPYHQKTLGKRGHVRKRCQQPVVFAAKEGVVAQVLELNTDSARPRQPARIQDQSSRNVHHGGGTRIRGNNSAADRWPGR